MNKTPVLQIRHAGGDNWFVAATWPDGRSEEIRGFKTETAASAWIAKKLHACLNEAERTNA
jgi:hypothetical protein